MLDFDFLAESRAKSLNEQEEMWRKAIWSPLFQALSQSMTDGEVESLVAFCPSVKHFNEVIRHLDVQSKASGVPPFTVLQQLADKAGVQPAEWIRDLPT